VRNPTDGGQALQVVDLLSFVVYGQRTGPGLIEVGAKIEVEHLNGTEPGDPSA